jgi:Tol biopolymer transport system component
VTRRALGLLFLAAAACSSESPPSACTADGYPASSTQTSGCTPGPDWIAYAFIVQGGSTPALFLMRPDGSCAWRVTGDAAFYGAPAFFPGGKKLAYASTRSGLNSLYVLDLVSGLETRLDTPFQFAPPLGLRTLAAAAPSVSPDGLTIAFEGSLPDYPGWSDVFAVPAAGGAVSRFTNDPVSATLPVWSKDGAQVYALSYGTGAAEIISTPPDGSMVATSVTSGSGLSSRFTISGDGTALVYARFSATGSGTKPTELVAWDLATSAVRVISSADEADPAVDAASASVAVSRRSASGYDLYLLDYASGAVKRQLTSCPGQAFGAAFSR